MRELWSQLFRFLSNCLKYHELENPNHNPPGVLIFLFTYMFIFISVFSKFSPLTVSSILGSKSSSFKKFWIKFIGMKILTHLCFSLKKIVMYRR